MSLETWPQTISEVAPSKMSENTILQNKMLLFIIELHIEKENLIGKINIIREDWMFE